jgi:hypothetical protein
MTTMDPVIIQQSIEFLAKQSLDPAEAHPKAAAIKALGLDGPIDPVADTKDVYVDVGGGVVFAAPFAAQMKLDILYSWEYSQRWANKQIHDKYGKTDPSRQGADTIFTHSTEWYSYFTQMLKVLHWVAKDFAFKAVHVSGSTFEVDKIILDILMTALGDDAQGKKAIQDAIALMKGLGCDSGQLTLWNHHSSSNGYGSFQMGAVLDGGEGMPVMTTGAMQIDSKQESTDCFFFFHYSTSDTQMTQGSQQLIFNQDAYARKDAQGRSARDMVAASVAGTSTDFIADCGGIE